MGGLLHDLLTKFYQKQDPAGLGIARFLFGLLMIIDIFEERGLLFIVDKWGDDESCYFPLFDNLPRLSVEFMFMLYLTMLISATGIMLGFFYRWSCFCFMVSYWYLFFLDKTTWNNHSYLYGLMSILFLMTNAHHYWSVDGLIWPSIRNTYVPKWNYTIFKFQIFLLYFFAGLKKIDHDWVSGYSMSGLSRRWIFDPFRMFLSDEQIDFFMVHICGLIFDLSVGFLLLFDATRKIGLLIAYMFHGMNAVLFSIGMFSYACMAMVTIFCYPDWPKKIILKFPNFIQLLLPATSNPQENKNCVTVDLDKPQEANNDRKALPRLSFKRVILYFGIFTYILLQLTLPFSHFLTKGYNSWTQGLYGYSWDMMVHSWDTQHVVIKVVDKVTGKKQFLRPGAFTPGSNVKNRIFAHPDMIKQYSTCLAQRIIEIEEFGISKPEIYFDVWKSLNGRYQQRMIDPHVDLVSAQWSVSAQTPWLLPLLVELSPWRSTLKKIRSINVAYNNATDIVFVADFPTLYLENYIAPEIIANVTVLSGDVVVEMGSTNISITVNETLNLPSNATHTIHTVSSSPSCYMYIYYNTTWFNFTKDEIIQSDPVLQKDFKMKETWGKMSYHEKLYIFLSRKLRNYKMGVWQMYYVISMILEVGENKNEGKSSDDEL